ncbi:Eukaryotic/viral aspartic protease [Phytophthora palmivora]|uniref:Eukaryotic/viral aspartic protease n=1 Tax=Phytophthora palmivora TaxID=4796 RepID=A0A2P4X7D4_9STRA|nr:Eukaryotic/viral aspartic protease [Phytophthora palmivora]
MRALVKGAVNDVRTRILLDTEANVSVISANYAKRLRLPLVKTTLGLERVYEFEMWIMNHSAGVDVVLGMDFMIPAGVRLDLFHGTDRLPDEVMVPVIKSLSAADDEPYGTQILAYAESRDETLFERERELYECWLAEQPPAVERKIEEAQVYCAEDMIQATDTTSRECGRRDDSLTFRAVVDASDGVAVEGIPTKEPEHTIPVSESGDRVFEQAQRRSSTHATDDVLCTESSNGVAAENIGASDQVLDETPTESYIPMAAGVVAGRAAEENDVSEHFANDIKLTDYAQELAFLPDLTEVTVTALDYTGPNVQYKDLDVGQQQKLVDVLKRHEKIMISSGNALPPPAYGVVCDIDMVNAATAIMEYAMPLVDDLLTDMEAYLWFCSLDAASRFWAIMMTQKARKISAFACALDHFEWLRMPFGL